MDVGEETLEKISKCENFNKWLYENIEGYVGDRIMEIGPGIGNITEFFIHKEKVIGVDISKKMLEKLSKRIKRNNFEFYKCDVTDDQILKLRKKNIDTVVCLNVLEHTKKDKKALENMHKVLKKGGRIILLVPNIKFLYGNLDKNLGHYRRYAKKELIRLMKEAGFKVEKVFYMNLLGILGWFINDKILRRKVLPHNQLLFYNKIAPLAKNIEKMIGPPTGLSIICIAGK